MGQIPFGQRLKAFISTLILALIITAFIGVFDFMMIGPALRQIAARSYPTTTGNIVSSEIETSTDSDGSSHRPRITFSYEVNGQMYESSTWRYGDLGLSDSTYAREIIDTYPSEKQVTVHYNPVRPRDAVLSTEIDGTDRFAVLFLSIFNFLTLGAWCLCLFWLRLLVFNPPAGGLRLIQRGAAIHVRMPRIGPVLAAAMGFGGVCFVSVFIAGFLMHMAPPVWFIYSVWVVALLAAIGTYLWRSLALAGGGADLIVDATNRVLSLPPIAGRKERAEVAFDAVRSIEIKSQIEHSSEGSSRTWAPMLIVRDGGSTRREKAADFYSEPRARGFAQWLRQQIGHAGPS